MLDDAAADEMQTRFDLTPHPSKYKMMYVFILLVLC